MARALITGIGGQDGTLLAELLLDEGYELLGLVRDPASPSRALEPLLDRVEVERIDLGDPLAWARTLERFRPQEVYNLASISHVPRSWEDPTGVLDVCGRAVAALLDAVRRTLPDARVFQASSAEIFGEPDEAPQSEGTAIAPLTPYGAAKAYAHLVARAYRRRYGLFAATGILYNHESPRRPRAFVTRKVTRSAAAISLGLDRELRLGSLDARRDWGYAGDYVRAMWLVLRADRPDEYVIATGETHSVEELIEVAFEHAGLDWRRHVVSDPALERGQAESRRLVGDSAKARTQLGWEPAVGFADLVRRMVDADLESLRREAESRA